MFVTAFIFASRDIYRSDDRSHLEKLPRSLLEYSAEERASWREQTQTLLLSPVNSCHDDNPRKLSALALPQSASL